MVICFDSALSQKECEWFSSIPPRSKDWSGVCVYLKGNNVRHGHMMKVVEILLRLHSSNASIERAFLYELHLV
jgi:hypothetical protein